MIDGFLKVVRPVCKDGRQFLSKHMWCGGCGMHLEALLSSSWQASMHTMAACSSFSHLPNTDALSLLWVQTFS